MQRIGEEAGRLFKALAGRDRETPLGSFVVALYVMLFLVAFMLVAAWLTGTPPECIPRAGC